MRDDSLRVGIWPASLPSNSFVATYASALRGVGASVVDVRRPYDVSSGTLDVLHIHWPEEIMWRVSDAQFLWRMMKTIAALRRLRRSGTKIVWMVHNLEPHELSPTTRLIWSFYRSRLELLVDGFMTLSPATLDIVRNAIPKLGQQPGAFVWHPSYQVDAGSSADQLRGQLNIPADGRIFAFVGMIRRYKGLEELLEAFAKLERSSDRLLIGGRPIDRMYADEVETIAREDRRITLLLEDLSDERFDACLKAADVIVLPFAKYLHSGSLVHALCANRPIITPDTPYADALGREVGADWVQTYDGPLSASHLEHARHPSSPPKLSSLDQGNVGTRALSFYQKLLASHAESQAA